MDTTTHAGIIRGKKSLSVMPTFSCPASCSNCGTLSGPWERTNLSLDKVLQVIREAKRLDFSKVVFTGGEVTLRWNDLLVAIAEATRLDLPTRIVTNAHWATSLTRAEEKLRELVSTGLSEVNYSTGDEHARFIPLENIIHATVAAVEMDLPVCILVELRNGRSIDKESILRHPRIVALSVSRLKVPTIVEGPWMPLRPDLAVLYPDGMAVNRFNLGDRTGCEEVLRTYTLQADGRIGCCCGIGLRVIPELNVAIVGGDHSLQQAIAAAEKDFLKLWIHFKGPERVLAWAAAINPVIQWENMYTHRCQACQRIHSDPQVVAVLHDHYSEIVMEVRHCAGMRKGETPGATIEK